MSDEPMGAYWNSHIAMEIAEELDADITSSSNGRHVMAPQLLRAAVDQIATYRVILNAIRREDPIHWEARINAVLEPEA